MEGVWEMRGGIFTQNTCYRLEPEDRIRPDSRTEEGKQASLKNQNCVFVDSLEVNANTGKSSLLQKHGNVSLNTSYTEISDSLLSGF